VSSRSEGRAPSNSRTQKDSFQHESLLTCPPPPPAVGQQQEEELRETDPHKLAQRQKQVDIGKNTLGYQRYRDLVPL
jgi:hypothetical protein